jgi:alkaline phosphatase D
VVFEKSPPAANFSPFAGLQFFGQVDIDGRTAVMTVTLKEINGASGFTQKLQPFARYHSQG